MASDTNLEKLVRLGTVTAVDAGKRQARVKYEDTGSLSGWLYVLAAPPSRTMMRRSAQSLKKAAAVKRLMKAIAMS